MNKFKILLVVFFSGLAGLMIIEVFLRYLGRYETYTERNGIAGYVLPFDVGDEKWYHTYPAHYLIKNTIPIEVEYFTNNEGFRDSDLLENTKKYKRILTLGDSFTEGIGATNDSTFQKQLFSMLKAKGLDSIEVYNAGVSGSDPVFEYRVFKDRLLRYEPDLVVVTVNASDITDIITRGGFERFMPDGSVRFNKGPWFEKYYARSRLVRVLVHDVFRYDWQFNSPSGHEISLKKANAILCQAVDSFMNLSISHKYKLLMVFHPTMYEFKNQVSYEFQPLIQYCQKKGIPYVDICDVFCQFEVRPENAETYYWSIDQHFNNKGYGILAAGIFGHVTELLQ